MGPARPKFCLEGHGVKLCFRRSAFTFAAILAIMAAFTTLSYAGKVKITGAEATVYDQNTDSFIFTGPVTITDGTTTITGEHVSYKGKEEVLELRGPVQITQNGTTLSGKDLIYDLKKSEGSISQALASTTPAGAISPVYVSGEKVSTCQERTVLNGARLTTCDPDNPGYYLVSRTIEIYPGDKLVLSGVKFVESGLTLFYWPRITFSLKRADPNQASEEVVLPKVGYSVDEGWYMKSSFGYRGPGSQRGRILVDYMQLLGWGYGVSHILRADTNGSEKILAYAQPNRSTNHTDIKLSFDEQRTFSGDIRVTGHSGYSTSYTLDDEPELTGEQRRVDNQWTLSQNRKSGSTSLSYNDTRLDGVDKGYEIQGTANHTQNLGDGWNLRLNTSLHKRNRTDIDKDRNLVGYLAEIERDTPDWSLGLIAEDRFNPDLAKDETDADPSADVTWNWARRLPEVTLGINRISIAGHDTPFTLDTAWGRITESRFGGGNFTTERTHVAGRVKPLHLNLGALGKLQWSGALTRRVYGTGDSHWVAGAQSQYDLPVSKNLSLNADYRYEQAFGDPSPLNFDRVTDQEKVQGRVDYHTDGMQLSVSSGYDLMSSSPLDIVGSVRIQPSEKVKLQAQGAYSLDDSDWVYVIGTAQYTPDEHLSLNLGAKYDMQLLRADRVDAQLQWNLKTWQLGYTGIYDGINNKFDRGDFTITRDLGCRAIDLRYNQSRKEVWLEYRITAFPAASVKFGATEQHLMFDVRGWEEVLATE